MNGLQNLDGNPMSPAELAAIRARETPIEPARHIRRRIRTAGLLALVVGGLWIASHGEPLMARASRLPDLPLLTSSLAHLGGWEAFDAVSGAGSLRVTHDRGFDGGPAGELTWVHVVFLYLGSAFVVLGMGVLVRQRGSDRWLRLLSWVALVVASGRLLWGLASGPSASVLLARIPPHDEPAGALALAASLGWTVLPIAFIVHLLALLHSPAVRAVLEPAPSTVPAARSRFRNSPSRVRTLPS